MVAFLLIRLADDLYHHHDRHLFLLHRYRVLLDLVLFVLVLFAPVLLVLVLFVLDLLDLVLFVLDLVLFVRHHLVHCQ